MSETLTNFKRECLGSSDVRWNGKWYFGLRRDSFLKPEVSLVAPPSRCESASADVYKAVIHYTSLCYVCVMFLNAPQVLEKMKMPYLSIQPSLFLSILCYHESLHSPLAAFLKFVFPIQKQIRK